MKLSVHYSSKSTEWATPQWLFDALDAEFGFQLDVCATPENAKCQRFFTIKEDGLAKDWGMARCWMNPPYGDPEHPCKSNCTKKRCGPRGFHLTEYQPGIVDWMRKAWESARAGATVVCLVPARTDTEWWHDYAMRGDVRLLRGRLKFGDGPNSAPFPSAVVVLRPVGQYLRAWGNPEKSTPHPIPLPNRGGEGGKSPAVLTAIPSEDLGTSNPFNS